MDFLQRNLFAQLRTDNFGTKEELEPMTVFKKKKIAQMMKNLNAVPAGAVLMNNSFLNRLNSSRFKKRSATPSTPPLRRSICCAFHW